MKIIIDGKEAEVGGGSAGEAYPTEETRIGTWIDGKPLYRRVVEFIYPSSTAMTRVCEIDNAIIPHVCFGGITIDDGGLVQLPYSSVNNSYICAIVANPGYISVECGSSILALIKNHKAFCVLEYTKTTD